jgi:hypothetical protein
MATDWLDKLYTDKTATDVSYDNTASGLTASTVQDAIDELADGGGGAGQEYSEITVTGLTGTHNAWAPAGLDGASSINITNVTLGSATINGILAPSSDVNGLIKVVRAYASAYTLTLTHNSGSAAAGNKIMCDGSHDIVIGGPTADDYIAITRVNGNWFAYRLDKRTLTFGTTRIALPSTAPTANYVVTAASSSALQSVLPGTIMPRMAGGNNTSVTARNFSQNRRETWNGGTTPSFTYGGVGATDGCIETIFFPASLGLTTFTLSTDLDPTGTVAYAFDGGASAYLLTMQYFVTGPCVVCSLRKVTDL